MFAHTNITKTKVDEIQKGPYKSGDEERKVKKDDTNE